ncbi:MAG: leucine-rich repeat domain-containing protein [Bacilli bacterium]|nr:leucine-rich repeat domain-containing protein [Bacilli bacterium]
MKKALFEKLKMLALLFVMLPLNYSCSDTGASTYRAFDPIKNEPHYLIEGNYEDTSGNFSYYLISSGTYANTYAVALAEDKRGFNFGNNLTVPSTYNGKDVTCIWRNGFQDLYVSTITLSTKICVIDYEAFIYSRIRTITIPYTVESIGEAAFYSCTSLTTVNIQNSNKSATSTSALNTCTVSAPSTEDIISSTLRKIPAFCFLNCKALQNVYLPTAVEIIDYEAFNGCSSFSTMLSFQSITTIRARAFQGCTSLTKIFIPKIFFDSDGVIEPHAFNYCSSSLQFYFSASSSDFSTWYGTGNNSLWGWHKDRDNPSNAANNYYVNGNYTLISGGSYRNEDWEYTVTANGEFNDVTITKYVGSTSNVTFLAIPDNLPITEPKNKVRVIAQTALNDIKGSIRRIYLPTTLRRIENSFFDGFNNCTVIDSNVVVDVPTINDCKTDETGSMEVLSRVDLSDLTDLEIVCDFAFSKAPHRQNFKYLHLPYGLKYIGNQAFCNEGTNEMIGVTDFRWDYDDEKSQLVFMGHDQFYRLGYYGNGRGSSGFADRKVHYSRFNTDGTEKYKLSTIIFPRTFSHFGIPSSICNQFDGINYTQYAAHFFANCPLLGTVIFKGSNVTSETANLVIPIQTFAFCENLHTLICEERSGRSIFFHCENGKWSEPAVGSNAGRYHNDFAPGPALQNLILPNQSTKLIFQYDSMQGNSRAALYLTSTETTNIYYNGEANVMNVINTWKNGNEMSTSSINDNYRWRTIGDESFSTKGYIGYCFNSSATSKNNGFISSYNISQIMPTYENIYYEETINEPTKGINNVTVSLGSGNSNRLVIRDGIREEQCAYVCSGTGNNATAILSKYLYDRDRANSYDSDDYGGVEENTPLPFNGSAKIPETVTKDGTTYTVTEVGDSAFSAAFSSDGWDSNNHKTIAANHPELQEVILPNSITRIGEYAFIRAYGVRKISSYSRNDTPSEWSFPSGLTEIGKYAFLFSGLQKACNIPSNCIFYENTSANTTNKIGSVFSNCIDLRLITFANGTSQYYTTSTYTNASSETCTSSLYSTDAVAKNASGLQLVLNRDYADFRRTVPNEVTVWGSNGEYTSYNANNREAASLFGAFKMGYWIDELSLGAFPKDSNNNTIPQALFSAIATRKSYTSTAVTDSDSYVYLYVPVRQYENNLCNLRSESLTNFIVPEYAFSGCEILSYVNLPYNEGASIPDGLFADITTAGMTYSTPGATSSERIAEPGVLDLTYTGYSSIGSDCFKNNTVLRNFTAPNVANFTIGSGAFQDCTGLTSIDLSNVTGSITINASAFKNCTSLSSITWPTSATVTINDAAFYNCDSLTSVTFPAGTSVIAKESFRSCDSLETVDLSNITTSEIQLGESSFANNPITSIVFPSEDGKGNINLANYCFAYCTSLTNVEYTSHVKSIGRYAFSEDTSLASFTAKNNADNTLITGINDNAFYKCSSLNNFDFAHLTRLQTIYAHAFEQAGSLGGDIVIPASVTTIGTESFKNTAITSVVYQGSNVTLFTGCFRDNSSLTSFTFSNGNCNIVKNENYSKGSFWDNCTSLTTLVLPSGFTLSYNWQESVIDGCTQGLGLTIYSYQNYTLSTTIDENVFEWQSGQYLNSYVRFYVNDWSHVVNTNVSPAALLSTSSVYYWTLDDSGNIIDLGTSDSLDTTNNIVTFSSGYTMDQNGTITAP